jgi:hypothetical protein
LEATARQPMAGLPRAIGFLTLTPCKEFPFPAPHNF